MGKTRCKLSPKEYEEKKPDDPKYQCKKCGKVAKKEDQVCKPKKIKK